jgi:putative ABC transport system permease protein
LDPLVDWLRGLAFRLRGLIDPDHADRDIRDELRFHLEMEERRLVQDGLDAAEARRVARVRFGGEDRYRERTRDSRGTRIVEDGMQDVKFGLRMLAKNPVFTLVAIVTLALGIGANTAIYTVVQSVLLEPLPFEQPDELTLLFTRNDEQNQQKYMVSPMDFDDWRRQNSTFEAMSAFWPTTGTVTENDGNPTRVNVVYTTEDFFETLGARPLIGRTFTPEEGPGSTPVAILAHGFWERRFGGDPSVVGRAITLDGGPMEVIGVLRPEHTFPSSADMWINMTWPMQIQSRFARWMSAVGRLADNAALETARADLVTLAARIEQENPESNRGWTVTVSRLKDELVGDTRTALLVLLTATGLVLLIACANVANLLLSRSEARTREIAVRTAFGAGRWRLVRQLLTESLLLSGGGALFGLALGWLGVRGLLAVAPVTLPRESAITLDGGVLLVVLAVSVVTGLLFGLAPIARLVLTDIHSSIRDGARSTGTASGHRLQNTFVVGQLALALMLVAGAGLLVRSFANLRSVDTGFQADGVLTAELDLPTAVAANDTAVIDFYDSFRRRIASIPGVAAVGDAATLPLAEALDYSQPFVIEDHEFPPELEPRAYLRPVAAGFFQALRTPVVAGRVFDERDRLDQPGVVVVNEAWVRRFMPGEDPIGERFVGMSYRFGPLGALNKRDWEIVGVVKDVKYEGLRADVAPAIYFPGLQSSLRRRTLVVRTTGDPASLVGDVRGALAELNPTVALTDVRTMREVLAGARSRDRFSTLLLSLFGIVALLLASVGVYGVLAYAVTQRRGEVGIRMALGADRGDVRSMILGDGLRLVGTGLVLGMIGAAALSGVLSSQLYGVGARDPWVLASVAGILLGVGLLASLVPAWRATRVDPVAAMRGE